MSNQMACTELLSMSDINVLLDHIRRSTEVVLFEAKRVHIQTNQFELVVDRTGEFLVTISILVNSSPT